MSKKVILSTLLISSALLGTTVAANAATSGIKAESKLVTVEKSNAKIYKNSKLQESKKAKKGTVYKVNGYRDIDGKKYYRVYQQDTKGKNVYKGYLLDKDAKDLQGQAPAKADRFVEITASKAPAWKNLYFNIKIKDYNGQKHSSNFEVKTAYKLGDKTYYSLYRDQKWMGYMNSKDTEVLIPENVAEGKQAYKVDKAYDTYSDIYFTKNGVATVGDKVTVKHIYTFGSGRKYASIYNAETGKWIGYINLNALSEDNIDTSSLEAAIKQGKEIIDNEKQLTGVEPVKKAVEEGEKVLQDVKNETATQAEVDSATKNIDLAIKGVREKPTSIYKEEVRKLEIAIQLLKNVNKIGAENLNNDENYNTVLQNAESVLKMAKEERASQEQIDKAIKSIEDFISGLTLNNNKLLAMISELKESISKVYMTQTQEQKFNQLLSEAETIAKNNQLSNFNKLKNINEQLNKAKVFINDQPTEKDVQKLINAINQEQTIEKKFTGIENKIFENWNSVVEKDTVADKMLEEIKKDKAPSDNTATIEYTAQNVQDVAKSLNDAIANLQVNQTTLQKYETAVNNAIAELDPEHQVETNKLLSDFKTIATNSNIKNLTQMIDAANKLNAAIHTDQVQEINNAIDKAKRIEGVSSEQEQGSEAPNAKFYDQTTYNAMNIALTSAEQAAKKLEGNLKTRTVEAGAIQVANGKEAANKEKELIAKINALQVKQWTSETTDTATKLTKYHPTLLVGEQTSRGILYREDKIEVPGKLKDEPTQLEVSGPIVPARGPINGNYVNSSRVTIDFITQDNTKVLAPKIMNTTFQGVGTVDVTGLDTSRTTSMVQTFQDNYGSTVKGLENLDVSQVTNMTAIFANSNIQELNLSGWKLNSNVNGLNSMFVNMGQLTKITLPNDPESAKKICDALNSCKLTLPSNSVEIWHNGKQVGTIKKGQDCTGISTIKK